MRIGGRVPVRSIAPGAVLAGAQAPCVRTRRQQAREEPGAAHATPGRRCRFERTGAAGPVPRWRSLVTTQLVAAEPARGTPETLGGGGGRDGADRPRDPPSSAKLPAGAVRIDNHRGPCGPAPLPRASDRGLQDRDAQRLDGARPGGRSRARSRRQARGARPFQELKAITIGSALEAGDGAFVGAAGSSERQANRLVRFDASAAAIIPPPRTEVEQDRRDVVTSTGSVGRRSEARHGRDIRGPGAQAGTGGGPRSYHQTNAPAAAGPVCDFTEDLRRRSTGRPARRRLGAFSHVTGRKLIAGRFTPPPGEARRGVRGPLGWPVRFDPGRERALRRPRATPR